MELPTNNEKISSLMLRKGFLLQSSLSSELESINPIISPEIVNTIVPIFSHSKKKLITEKDFIENIAKINLILDNIKDDKDAEKRKAIEESMEFFLTLSKKAKQERNKEILSGDLEEEKQDEQAEKKKEEQAEKKQEKIPLPQVPEEQFGEHYSVKNYYIPIKKFCVDDFTEHFKARFNALKEILQGKIELENLTSISKISQQRQSLSIIGIVYDKRKTKNKNIILKMEDMTGQISVVVSTNNKELGKKAEDIMLDEVIGIKCFGTSEILFANEIVFPDIGTRKKTLPREEYAVFTSDIHLGSKMFLEDEFINFLKWLNLENGSEQQKEVARKVKYLFILGDSVDGVGVYPGQEKMLTLIDVKEQYKKLVQFLKAIRKDITIFLCPGQHDATRLAEPQPPISPIYAPELYAIKNLCLVSNPAMITIGKSKSSDGFKVLMYHGASFHNVINETDELRLANAHDNPTKVMKNLLKRRLLAPSHDSTTYLPSSKDFHLMYEVPDIIATGDLHRAEVSEYNNIILIAASCWQSITPFEEKVGNHPDPCKVPSLNLKTREIKILDFS